MQHLNSSSFGYTIAYIIPGAICWLTIGDDLKEVLSNNFGGATIGGLVSTTIIVLFFGLTFSTIRWLLIDRLHRWTGLQSQKWRFDKLVENLSAFESLGSFHYQYYQFYANSIVAIVIGNVNLKLNGFPLVGWLDFVSLLWCILFWLGSRDTLQKYNARVDQLLT